MMPLWLSVGICALAWSSGAFFGFGILERRLAATAVVEQAKPAKQSRRRYPMLVRYRRPIVYGSLAGSLVLFVWVVASLFLNYGAHFAE